MAGERSVVKHSYLTGKDKGVARAQAHLRYIQFRSGVDKDEEARSFFNGLRDDIIGREVAQRVSEQDPRATVMHKLILSPGVQGADVKEYCREVMADLSSRKGLDLDWYAVQHDNTDNPHCHIVVMGKDIHGHRVRLGKEDYKKVKEAGDRYLERNRLLDRDEREKDKDNEKEKSDRNPVDRFVASLKAAAREFAREMSRGAGDKTSESKRESRYETRKREKEEEKQKEVEALGAPIDLDQYLAKKEAQELKEKERKEKAWKEYCQPIHVDRGEQEPLIYNRASSLEGLQALSKDYEIEEPQVRASLSDADAKRLGDWITEKVREEKRIEAKAEKLQSIDVELDSDTKGNWSQASSLEELRKLESLTARGDVYLDDAERKALASWIKKQELKEPIRERENLTAAAEDKPGRDNVSEEDKISWKGQEFNKYMPLEELKNVRQKLLQSSYSRWLPPEEFSKLCSWIGTKEKYGDDAFDKWDKEKDKEKNKSRPGQERGSKRQKSPIEKGMERAVRTDRMARWDNYYKQKAEQRTHLEGQRENLKAQVRALNKFEKERETVDGQYSEIWGADKSALAAGPMGAAVGGLRPLGANQLLRLLKEVGKNEEMKRERAQVVAKDTQERLEADGGNARVWLDAQKPIAEKQPEKETPTPSEKPADKTQEKPAEKTDGEKDKVEKKQEVDRQAVQESPAEKAPEKEPPAIDNRGLETENKELGKDIKSKKAKEDARDQRASTDPDKGEREDPFKYDPWGRY